MRLKPIDGELYNNPRLKSGVTPIPQEPRTLVQMLFFFKNLFKRITWNLSSKFGIIDCPSKVIRSNKYSL